MGRWVGYFQNGLHAFESSQYREHHHRRELDKLTISFNPTGLAISSVVISSLLQCIFLIAICRFCGSKLEQKRELEHIEGLSHALALGTWGKSIS